MRICMAGEVIFASNNLDAVAPIDGIEVVSFFTILMGNYHERSSRLQ